MSSYFEEKNSEKQDLGPRKPNPWTGLAAYLIYGTVAVVGINHLTRDKLGLEKLVGLKQPASTNQQYQLPDIKAGSLSDYIIQNSLPDLSPEQRKNLKVIWLLRDGKLDYAIVKTGVANTSHTTISEVVYGELKEGDQVILGYESSGSQSRTQQSSDAMRSFQRM